jgi:hypothetical protein
MSDTEEHAGEAPAEVLETVPEAGLVAPDPAPAESAEASAGPADGAPEAAPDPADPALEQSANIGAVLEAWLHETMRDSPIARSTEAWNHLVASLPALRDRIMKEI